MLFCSNALLSELDVALAFPLNTSTSFTLQALNMSRNHSPIASVKEKFTEAMNRFRPNKGDDKELLDKCEKHFNAILQKHSLMLYAKEKFLRNGEYNLEGRFTEVLRFEQKASKFFSSFLCDSFLVEEVHVSSLVLCGLPCDIHSYLRITRIPL